MKCFEIKSRLPCNLSLHHACSNRRAYRQYILDKSVHVLSSPYSSKDQNKPTWITIHLTSTRRFAGVLFYYLQYMHMYTTSIYTLHICHCVFFIHFRGGTFRQNQVLRALLDAYPAAAEEKHPQVEVMGFFLFVFFFWGCFLCWFSFLFVEGMFLLGSFTP